MRAPSKKPEKQPLDYSNWQTCQPSYNNKKKVEPADNIIRIPVAAYKPFPWHLELLDVFDSKTKNFYMLNWHRRAMKTTMTANLLIRECCKHPQRTYVYIAPTYQQGKLILWQDPEMLVRYLPETEVKRKNETDLFVEFRNGSYLKILGGDNPDSIRGSNGYGYVIDEWPMFSDHTIWSKIIRPILTRKISDGLDAWAIFTFTPRGRNHAFKMWNKAQEWEQWYTSKKTVADTGLISDKDLEQARQESHPSEFRQEYYCDFTSDDERILIPFDDLERLKKHFYVIDDTRRIVGLDPSQGGDECVSVLLEGGAIIDKLVIKGERDCSRIAGQVMVFMGKHKCQNIAVDAIGIGAGIAAMLRDAGKDVQEIISSNQALDKERYSNLRTEMWWYAANQIRDFKVPYPDDEKIREQLSCPRYEPFGSRGRVMMETKDKTKKSLGSSPDHADAYIYALWGLKFVLRDSVKQVIRRRNRSEHNRFYGGGAGGW